METAIGLSILFIWAYALLVAMTTWAMWRLLTRPPRITTGHAIGRGLPTDPKDAGYKFLDNSINTDDNSTINLWTIQGDQPTGPTIILLHGWGDSKWTVMNWLPAVCSIASRVMLFDLPGHGESLRPICTWFETEITDILAIIEHAKQTDPKSPILLMGISMGGALAISAAANHEHVAGVIADNPYRYPLTAIARFLKLKKYPRQPMLWLIQKLMYYRWPILQHFDTAAFAQQLKCPLMIIQGDDDPLMPVTEAQAIGNAATNHRIDIWHNVIHNGALEADQTRYMKNLDEFVDDAIKGYHGSA